MSSSALNYVFLCEWYGSKVLAVLLFLILLLGCVSRCFDGRWRRAAVRRCTPVVAPCDAGRRVRAGGVGVIPLDRRRLTATAARRAPPRRSPRAVLARTAGDEAALSVRRPARSTRRAAGSRRGARGRYHASAGASRHASVAEKHDGLASVRYEPRAAAVRDGAVADATRGCSGRRG